MSKKSHSSTLDPMLLKGSLITPHVYTYRDAFQTPDHHHDGGQLIYAAYGVMTIRTESGSWVVPPQRAVWVPAGVTHSTRMSGKVAMHTLFLSPKLMRHFSEDCFVVNVSPLLREVILHICSVGPLFAKNGKHRNLINIASDMLADSKQIPLQLPMPRDPRALKLARIILEEPSDASSLQILSKRAGASKKTLERLFEAETHLTFGRWRQQARLLHALRLLAQGKKITQAALDSGYESPSAFTGMFKRLLGTTPNRFFRG